MMMRVAITVVLTSAIICSTATIANAPAETTARTDGVSIRVLRGKLFYTDDERAKLQVKRKPNRAIGAAGVSGNANASVEADESEELDDANVVSRRATLSGFLRRSDGSTTYWINGGGNSGTRHQTTASEIDPHLVGEVPRAYLVGMTIGDEKTSNKDKSPIETNVVQAATLKPLLTKKMQKQEKRSKQSTKVRDQKSQKPIAKRAAKASTK